VKLSQIKADQTPQLDYEIRQKIKNDSPGKEYG
jgi:hypothetical protein